MKQFKKYRRQLSFYIIVLLIIVVGEYFYSTHLNGFNNIVLLLSIATFLILIRVYYISNKFYKEIRRFQALQEQKQNKQITINDIIEQENTDIEKESQKNKDDLDQLVLNIGKSEDSKEIANTLLSQIANDLEIVQGIVYIYNSENDLFESKATYAYFGDKAPKSFKLGEGLNGQVAKDKKKLIIRELPLEYLKVLSGLGQGKPKLILLAPLIHEEKTVALVELAFFVELEEQKINKFEQILNQLANKFA